MASEGVLKMARNMSSAAFLQSAPDLRVLVASCAQVRCPAWKIITSSLKCVDPRYHAANLSAKRASSMLCRHWRL